MDSRQNRASEGAERDRQAFGAFPSVRKERSATPWVVAGAVVFAMLLVLVLTGRRHGATRPNQLLPLDPYAKNLVVSGLAMSESTSLSGGKSTFLDGVIRNAGSRTVSGVDVQVLFGNDEGMPLRIEAAPLMLIRTREPYVDTQPLSAAPLKPGDSREFRLIFESLPQNWNTQMPEMHITGVSAK